MEDLSSMYGASVPRAPRAQLAISVKTKISLLEDKSTTVGNLTSRTGRNLVYQSKRLASVHLPVCSILNNFAAFHSLLHFHGRTALLKSTLLTVAGSRFRRLVGLTIPL